MILIFSILIFTSLITLWVTGCGSSSSGKANPFGLRREKSKTKFHVKGDTEVMATKGPGPMVSKAGEAPKNPEDVKLSQQGKAEEKKSQRTEKAIEKKPLISVEPFGDLTFKLESESQIRLVLKNISEEKIMFKIKVSDHAYNANPVFGTLETGESSDVVVTHIPSECKDAKLVIVNSKYVGEIDLARSFRNSKPTGGPITINLVAN